MNNNNIKVKLNSKEEEKLFLVVQKYKKLLSAKEEAEKKMKELKQVLEGACQSYGTTDEKEGKSGSIRTTTLNLRGVFTLQIQVSPRSDFSKSDYFKGVEALCKQPSTFDNFLNKAQKEKVFQALESLKESCHVIKEVTSFQIK